MKKALLFIAILLTSTASFAIDCPNIKLSIVAVQGNRDDNHEFQNKLILKLNKECAGKIYMHAALEHPAFSGFLSTALSAKAMDKTVIVSANVNSNPTSLSNQIAFIAITD